MEEGNERFVSLSIGESRMMACYGQELVGVEEVKPFVLMTVLFMAVRVYSVLHRPRTFGAVEVMKRDRRVRYAPLLRAFGRG